MLKYVETVLEKPLLYKKTEGGFGDDEHISMQMLEAHSIQNLTEQAGSMLLLK